MLARRIVITEMGVVVPSGRDLDSLWRAVALGQSAARRVSRFSTEDTPSHMAAEVEGFDPTLYMDRKTAKGLDLCHLYAVAAARLAESDAKIQGGGIDHERIGVAFGTSLGGIESVLASQAGSLQRGYHGAGIGAAINGYQTAPMTLHFQEAAPGCHLDYVPRESRKRAIRTAINLSCGFGGLNSSLVLRRFEPDRGPGSAGELAALGI